MQITRYRRNAVSFQQWFVGLAMMVLVPAAPGAVFGQPSPDPTGKVPGAVELPVDISIDIATGDEDTLPNPAVTIHLFNAKSNTEVDLALPKTNASPDHPSGAAVHAPFDTPPVTAPPFDTPPFVAPPDATPPVDVPVADLPPVEAPPVDVPTVEAPPADTLPISLPPTAGRP